MRKKEHVYNLDAYISDFLFEHKKLSAQGLGEFTIINGQAPNGAPLVEFTPNKGAFTSDELISFVAQNQGKNRIVTGFDIEAHFNQVKQFINIGTPWIVPGLGQLQLGKASRQLEFVQQQENEAALQHDRSKSKQAANDAHYQTYDINNPEASRSNTGTILVTLFVILALGAGGYYFYTSRDSLSDTSAGTKDTTAAITDTVISVPSAPVTADTTTVTPLPRTGVPATATTSTSPAGYRFVLNRTVNGAYARKRYAQLKTYGTQVYLDSVKRDSYSVYKVYLIKNIQSSDTTRTRDSLTKYYGKPVKVETAQ